MRVSSSGPSSSIQEANPRTVPNDGRDLLDSLNGYLSDDSLMDRGTIEAYTRAISTMIEMDSDGTVRAHMR